MWILLIIFLFAFALYLRIKPLNHHIDKNILTKDKTSLFLTLGTKIGVGSLIGTTSSIIIGGFSTVIWMVLFSLLSTSIILIVLSLSFFSSIFKILYFSNPNIVSIFFIFYTSISYKNFNIKKDN